MKPILYALAAAAPPALQDWLADHRVDVEDAIKAATPSRWVLVRAGRSGKAVHARLAEPREGARGFRDNHAECGQMPLRSQLVLVEDAGPAALVRVTCDKCRASLERRGLMPASAPAGFRYDVAFSQVLGKVREGQEDSAGESTNGGYRAVVVCDGMGGHAAGEVASAIGVQQLLATFKAWNPKEGLAPEVLRAGFKAGSDAIVEGMYADHRTFGMGTTIVAAVLGPQAVWYQYAGDSRLYWLRNGSVLMVTEDHHHGCYLLSCLGGGSSSGRPLGWSDVTVDPPVAHARLAVAAGDVLLLMTDGVSGEIPDDALARMSLLDDAQGMANAITDAVMRTPARDNATVCVVKVRR